MNNFSAGPQALGYLHQVRYALVLLLNDEESELRLEALDDIEVVRPLGKTDLFQLKHRAAGSVLTDASPDLWKTIRVWSTLVANNKLALGPTILSLVTTATAAPDSAPSFLRPGGNRDPNRALRLLLATAADSKNKALTTAFDAFNALTAEQQRHLVSKSYLLDEAPSILDSRRLLEDRIAVAVPRQHRPALADRVEGWWFNRCVQSLSGQGATITGYEVFALVADLARQFAPDALPIDFFGSLPTPQEAGRLRQRQFVTQLVCIGIGSARIEKAVADYYRAYAQRAQWARQQLLIGGEVERYDDRLREEWERIRLVQLDEVANVESDDTTLRQLGRSILAWMETKADFRIRSEVSEPYVMRGSYHILADRTPPRVWWHPRFPEQFAAAPPLSPGEVSL